MIIINRIVINTKIKVENNLERIKLKEKIAEILNIKIIQIEMRFDEEN